MAEHDYPDDPNFMCGEELAARRACLFESGRGCAGFPLVAEVFWPDTGAWEPLCRLGLLTILSMSEAGPIHYAVRPLAGHGPIPEAL